MENNKHDHKLKICFLAGTLGQGGAERQLMYILHALKAKEFNIKVLCLTKGEYWENEIKQLNIPLVWVGKRQNRLARIFSIIKEVKRFKPDIIQSSHFYTNFYAAIAAKLTGKKSVGAVRSNLNNELYSNGKIAGKLNLITPDILAINSQNAIKAALERLHIKDEKIFFLSNRIDIKKFSPIQDHKGNEAVTILSIGRLVPLKRFDKLIEIIADITKEHKIKTFIAGDGPEKDKLIIHSRKSGLSENEITFLGNIENIEQIYNKADIFILCSEWEGTPNVILEAMAAGLPVIASNVGDIAYIVQHKENGFVFESNNFHQAGNYLKELITDARLRNKMGTKSREIIEQKFKLDALYESLMSLYQKVLTQ